MKDDITFWKCPDCHGTGREIIVGKAVECARCDGTGNALVSGAEHRHRRRLTKIDSRGDKP